MGELVLFPVPEDHNDRLPQTMDEIKSNVEVVRQMYVSEVTETLLTVMVQQMVAGGFEVDAEEHNKDFGFLIETVRSTLCKTMGFYHPFQDVASELMQVIDLESGILGISDEAISKYIMKEKDGTKTEERGPEDVQA